MVMDLYGKHFKFEDIYNMIGLFVSENNNNLVDQKNKMDIVRHTIIEGIEVTNKRNEENVIIQNFLRNNMIQPQLTQLFNQNFVNIPHIQPTEQRTEQPTEQPTDQPTVRPTVRPIVRPFDMTLFDHVPAIPLNNNVRNQNIINGLHNLFGMNIIPIGIGNGIENNIIIDIPLTQLAQLFGPAMGQMTPVKLTVPKEELDKIKIVKYETLSEDIKKLNEKCTVCLCDFEKEDDVRVTKCKHAFHQTCIDKWLLESNYTCPVCRSEVAEHKANIN